MADPIPTLEDDPCGRATALKARRDEIILGDGVREVDQEHGNGVRRRVGFSVPNLAALEKEIARADQVCAIKMKKRLPQRVVVPQGGGW